MIDADDILMLSSDAALELLPELFPSDSAPVAECFQLPATAFEDDVLSLADDLPALRPLPHSQEIQPSGQSPLRRTEPLSRLFIPADEFIPDTLGMGEMREKVDWSRPTLRNALAVVPAASPAQSSVAADLAARLAAIEMPEAPLVEAEKHVVFALAGARYAVPMEQVLEVCDLEQFTPMVNVPEWVMGIINLRGDIISVVDLRYFLTASFDAHVRRQPLRNLVVVQRQRGDLTTCLAVENLLGLAHAPSAEIQKIERVLGDGLTPHTLGFFAQGNELLTMLNLESLLSTLEISG